MLLLVFNRPDTTKRVFEAVRQARPPKLYVAADGPRVAHEGDPQKVKQVREHILGHIDWPCEVKTLFRERNLGCKLAVSGGITWFFEHEPEGIILEDDRLPVPDFFPFCQHLLERYRNESGIAGITGDFRPLQGGEGPAAFSPVGYPLTGAWAGWRRVWRHYSTDMEGFDGSVDQVGRLSQAPIGTRRYFEQEFGRLARRELNTWNLQFTHLVLRKGWSFLHAHVNLVHDLGTAQAIDTAPDPGRATIEFPMKPVSGGFDYTSWLDEHVFTLAVAGEKAGRREARSARAKR